MFNAEAQRKWESHAEESHNIFLGVPLTPALRLGVGKSGHGLS